MNMATLSRIVRDHRTGVVHLPHEQFMVLDTRENLGRTLIRIKWQAGGESMLLAEDIEQATAEVAESFAGLAQQGGC